jgi:acyl transferase domain-containing protein/NADPH:quinone reductase-like Zn-dependent oxidoreductase/acyl carrier protein
MDRPASSSRVPDTVGAPLAREAPADALAILGMACRLPGGVEDPDGLWQLVHDGVDATCEIPADRWDVERYYAPGRQQGKMYTRRGGFVTGLGQFDARFFGISGTEATSMDPQQRILLEVCWASLEDAGIAPDSLAGTRTGVFVGIATDDFLPTHRDVIGFGGVGAHISIAAGRLSHYLDLRGPAIAVDTACSASLVALHLACQSLQRGECDLALVGGANAVVSPNQHLLLSDIGALSPDGRCKAFSASADGFGRAEGCGMIVLARHADARAARHRVRALVRATALNHDGHSSTLIAPSQEAQAALLREILAHTGLGPDDINYVETHGTGTAVGDPVEFEAMRAIFGGERVQMLRLGAVKSNLGHLESAAGMAALIKSVLALERAEIPPNLHVDRINPRIDLCGTGTAVVTERVPWQRPPIGTRLVGVSGFGFAGTNAHALLQEHQEETMTPPDRDGSPRLLCLSARTDTALAEMARRYERHLREHPSLDLADVCFTASAGRSHLEHRAAMVVGSREQALAALGQCARGEATDDVARGQRATDGSPRVAFLFTGQGAQYAGMGKSLYQREPVFREALDACAEALRAHLPRPLLEVMFASDDDDTIHETRYAQPALFSFEYALSRLWASWGIEPWAVLGHSVGELAAACVAGVMGLADGLALIAARGRLMQELPRNGTMVAVRAGFDEVREMLRGHAERISIAAVNGPRSTVISGERDAVAEVVAAFEQARVQARELRVSHAFHSALMEPMLDEFEAIARGIHGQPPRCLLISNLTGTALAEGQAPDASYWRRHVREPVLFEQGMRALAEAGVTAFLEIGPQPTLTAMARMFLDGGERAWISSIRPDRDESGQILAGAAALYAHGVDLDWAGFHRGRGGRKVALPTYPFERKRYWISSDRTKRQPDADAALLHPLLGRRLSAALATIPFLAELGPEAPAYLGDHRVHGMPVFPATAYIELALAAVRAVRGDGPCLVRNLSLERALVLPEGSRRRVQVLLAPAAEGRFTFEIHSQAMEARDGAESPWHLHARGDVAPLGAPESAGEGGLAAPGDLRAWKQRLTEPTDVAAQYRELTDEGLEYGPAFQGLSEIWTAATAPGEALATVRLPQEAGEDAAAYLLHPALLDACLQAIAAARRSQATPHGDTYLPVGVDEIRFYQSATEVLCHVGLVTTGHGASGLISADIDVVDGQGRPVARLRGVRLQRVDRSALRRLAEIDVRDWFYELTWQKLPAATASAEPTGGTWLLLADAGGTGRAVADALTRRGQRCIVVEPGIDATDPAAFDRIVAMAGEEGALRGVMYLGALDAHPMRATSAEVLASDAQRICAGALHLVQALGRAGGAPPALVLVTRGAQHVLDGDCVAAAQASLWGLGRVIALEHPEYRCRLIDLDGSSGEYPGAAPGSASAAEADVLVSEIWRDGSESQVALRGDQRHGARLTRARKLGTEAEERLPRPAGDSFALETERPGILEALTLRPAPRPRPGAGEIEVEVAAAGLNFRDVMNAMGAYPGGPEPLGGECAGRVTALGDGVQGFAVGDEVVVGLTRGAFRRFAIADARFVAHRPAWLDAAAAVTLPVTFLTAVYGLDHLARMRAGERVLIHAGAGGVGLAAIQLARRAGAEIFATAGSPRKRDYLRSLGVDHVLDSRSLAFADQIRAITGGRGVDIVLNSLAGEFVTRSMSLLGPGGRFIELGKVDILDASAVPAGVAYHHFDLGEECERDGTLWQKMFAELLSGIEAGALRPLPREVYAIEEARSAFRYMAQGRHIGKLVLTIDSTEAPRGQALHARARIAEDGAYLVTGGLGGLGLEVARWLVEHGAGRVVLMSRKPASDELLARIRELAGPAGDRITVSQGDVSSAEDVERVLGAIAPGNDNDGVAERAPGRPLRLRGVVHAAGLVDDGTLARQRWDGFARVMAPKVLGGWHLHRLTRDLDLDFFVVFSSMTAMLGNAGQGNYAAANAFVDALMHYRRGLGLPGLALDWGVWRDVGMAAADPARRLAPLQARGIDGIGPDEGMAAMEALLASRLVQVGILPVDWNRYLGGTADRAPALLAQLASAVVRPAQQARAVPTLTPERVEEALLAEIRRVLDLGEDVRIDPGEPLERLGLDSLMAVELRNRIGQMLGANLPATILFDYPSIDALASYIRSDVLQAPTEEPADAAPETPAGGDRIAAILAAIDALSDSEQQELLETLLEGDE